MLRPREEPDYPRIPGYDIQQVLGRGGVLTLRPTELVSDAYERIADQRSVDWQNREHFYAIAATVLRRVLIDHIRQRMSEKHGGDVRFVALDHPDSDAIAGPGDMVDWLAVDQALTRLALKDPASARVVELRLFSGLSVEQIAYDQQSRPINITHSTHHPTRYPLRLDQG